MAGKSDLEDVLTHEATHYVHTRSFDDAGTLAGWMSEGLAEYVSGSTSIDLAFEAARRGMIIPIVDTETDLMDRQDLMHFYSLKKDVGLAYGLSQSLVAYIVETYGGLDAFWRLARAFDETQDFDEALRIAFKVTYTGFDGVGALAGGSRNAKKGEGELVHSLRSHLRRVCDVLQHSVVDQTRARGGVIGVQVVRLSP